LQFEDIFEWMLNLGVECGYFGVFSISLVGALSIILPIPDSLVIFTIAGLKVVPETAESRREMNRPRCRHDNELEYTLIPRTERV